MIEFNTKAEVWEHRSYWEMRSGMRVRRKASCSKFAGQQGTVLYTYSFTRVNILFDTGTPHRCYADTLEVLNTGLAEVARC